MRQSAKDRQQQGGILTAKIHGRGLLAAKLDVERILKWTDDEIEMIVGHNLVVNVGLQLSADRTFGIGGPPAAVAAMGVTSDAGAAAAGDTRLDIGGDDDVTVLAFDATATRSGQVVSAARTFTQANANFVHRKIGMLNGTTDGTSTLYNAISAFTIDLVGLTFSITYQIGVTFSSS